MLQRFKKLTNFFFMIGFLLDVYLKSSNYKMNITSEATVYYTKENNLVNIFTHINAIKLQRKVSLIF